MLNLLIAGNIVMILTFVLRYSTLPPQVPLFYSRTLGEAQLVDSWMIFLLPFLLNVIYFLNGYLYRRFFSGNELLKKIFDYAIAFLIIGFTLVFVKIIFLIS